MIPTTFFLFVLLFFHGAYSHPTDTSLGKRGMKFKELKSVQLDGTKYNVKLLSSGDQGNFSDTYEMIEPINNVGAILKVVLNDDAVDPLASAKVKLELKFLKMQGLLVRHQYSGELGAQAYYIVVRNLRKQNPPYRPFYEWYIDDPTMDLAKTLSKMRGAVRAKLSALANEGILYVGSIHPCDFTLINVSGSYWDYHMSNIFVDKKLETVLPIDWGPLTEKSAGAIQIPTGTEEYRIWLDKFNNEMEENLLRRYSVKRLKRELKEHGSTLYLQI